MRQCLSSACRGQPRTAGAGLTRQHLGIAIAPRGVILDGGMIHEAVSDGRTEKVSSVDVRVRTWT